MQNHQEPQHESGKEDPPAQEEEVEPLLCTSFPEEVVEKILARMPFPSVLKSRVLSNSWNRKFSLSWEDAPRKALTPFQQEASSLSHRCPSYCPVFVSNLGLQGFDRASSQWKTLFPRWKVVIESDPGLRTRKTYKFSGSVMLVSSCDITESGVLIQKKPMFVINVITGSSAQVHPGRNKNLPVFQSILPGYSNTSYRVFQTHRIWNEELRRHELQTAIYDSKVCGWSAVTTTSTNLPDPPNLVVPIYFVGSFYSNNVYLHGKLYCLYNGKTGMLLCVNNVDSDQTWTVNRLCFPPYNRHSNQDAGSLLRCGEKLMLVRYTTVQEFFFYTVDLNVLGSLKQVVIERGTLPETTRKATTRWKQLASDANFIYIDGFSCMDLVVTYNVHSGEWGTIPPFPKKLSEDEKFVIKPAFQFSPRFSFTPGLNPFAIVEQSNPGPEFCF